eukprot:1803828-Amphidinium_carterae.2
MALPWEVRLADQQRLRRQSIRTLEYHEGGTVLAPSADSINELRIIAATEDLDTIIFTPAMLENLWQVLPPTPPSDIFEGVESDEIPDAQHDLSPNTLGQHVISEPRVRGEVPPHLRQTESGSSGVSLSPTPQVRNQETLAYQGPQAASAAMTLDYRDDQAASAAMSSCGAAGSCGSERIGMDDASVSSRGVVLPSDDETTPYNRWNTQGTGAPFPSEEVIHVPVESLPSSESPREVPAGIVDEDGRLDVDALSAWTFGESVRQTTRIIRHRQRHETRPAWTPLVQSSADAALHVPDAIPTTSCLPPSSPDIDEVLAMGREELVPGAASAASSSGTNHAASAAGPHPISPCLSEDSDALPLIALVDSHLPVRQVASNV